MSSSPHSVGKSPTVRELEKGVFLTESTLDGGPRVWTYTPAAELADPAGCVLVAPAGSNLITGMSLSDGDRPEHLPYVRAGFVVVAYDVSGPLEPGGSDMQAAAAMVTFRQSEAGVRDASAALDHALATYPMIDRDRLYAAGHSSAATLALLVAARESRIVGVAAYAPVTDVPNFLGADLVQQLDGVLSGYRTFLHNSSPINRVRELGDKPVLLFHAADDQVADPGESARLFDGMVKRHPKSRRIVVQSGGHYGSMIQEGIPAAIEWFESLARP